MDDLKMKFNGVKQELRQLVQLYFDWLEKFSKKSKIKDVE
jgi:hypothetical protein